MLPEGQPEGSIRFALRSIAFLVAAAAPLVVYAGTFEILDSSLVEPGAKIPTAISRDGEAVVGRVPQIGSGGFRWRRGIGFDDLPVFDNARPSQEFSIPFAVSDDGSTCAGEAYTDRIDARTAFLARPDGSILDLGLFMRPDTEFSSANGISADGTLVVGSGYGATHGTEAFLYDDVRGFRYVKDLVGAPVVTHAEDVSADGSTLVGWQKTPLGDAEAMIFSEANGIEPLGDLDGAPRRSRANAISSDGSTVVGRSEQNQGEDVEAFLWTRAGGMRGLGRLFGGDSEALDVSGDGGVVIGDGNDYTFIYTEAHGMMETRSYLSQVGGIDLAGWEIILVAGVSGDGQTLTGWARDPQDQFVTWIATVPEPRAGIALWVGVAGLAGLARRRCAEGRRVAALIGLRTDAANRDGVDALLGEETLDRGRELRGGRIVAGRGQWRHSRRVTEVGPVSRQLRNRPFPEPPDERLRGKDLDAILGLARAVRDRRRGAGRRPDDRRSGYAGP